MRRSWIFASALMSGCASYQPKPIDLERQAHSFAQRALGSEQLHQCLLAQPAPSVSAWPVTRWDRRMLSAAALCFSPTLDVARLRWKSVQADAFAAGARLNPALQFPFEYTTNQHNGVSSYTTGPIFDIPLETANKRGHKLNQATLLAQAAGWTLFSEEWKLRSQLRDTLLSIYAGRQQVQISLRQATLQQQVVDTLLQRDRGGAIARPEVERSKLRLAQMQSDLALTNQALLAALTHLAAIIGVPLAALDNVQFDLSEFEQARLPPPDSARRTALLHRADLRAALSEYDASQANLQLEVARQYPDVHISAGYTYDAGANKISLGLASLTLPLLDRNQGPIAQAESRRNEAAARVTALQDTISNDVAQADASHMASQQTLELASRAVATAARLMKSQSASFRVGAADRLEFIQAQMDYQTVVANHLRALIAMQQAAGLLESALQQPLPADGSSHQSPEYIK